MTDVGKSLYELINMLTNGDNITIRPKLAPRKKELYDLFRQQKAYDAAWIKANFKDADSFNLSNTKRQLYRQILEILWGNTPGDNMLELLRALGAVQVLARKALYHAALTRIDAVIEAAAGLEALHELLKALRIKRQLLEILNQPSTQADRDDALHAFAIDGMAESSIYEAIFSEMNEIRGMPLTQRPKALDTIAERLALAKPPTMVRNQIKRWRVIYASARMLGRHSECEAACKEVVESLDKAQSLMGDPDLRQDYFSNLHYLVLYAIESKDFQVAERKLSRIELVSKKWVGAASNDPIVHGRCLHCKLSLLLMRKDWAGVKGHLKNMLAEIDRPGRKLILTHKPAWHRTTLLSAFLIGNFRAVRWLCSEIKKAIVDPKVEQPFMSAISFYRLAVALEDEQDRFVEIMEKELAWLSDVYCFGEYEEIYFSALGKIRMETTPEEIASILDNMRTQITELFQNPLMWQHRNIFPVMQWIDSRVHRADIKTLVFQ